MVVHHLQEPFDGQLSEPFQVDMYGRKLRRSHPGGGGIIETDDGNVFRYPVSLADQSGKYRRADDVIPGDESSGKRVPLL